MLYITKTKRNFYFYTYIKKLKNVNFKQSIIRVSKKKFFKCNLKVLNINNSLQLINFIILPIFL